MDTNLVRLVDRFQNLRVLVVGEAMLDSYLAGISERLCREAPVPVVSVTGREDLPGGAANTAVNVRGLGCETVFLSVVGDDPEGMTLKKALDEAGVSTGHLLVHSQRTTLAKQRVISGAQLVVRFDQGSTEPLAEPVELTLLEHLQALWLECDAVIVSDYNYGILTPHMIEVIGTLQKENPRVLLIDSKRLCDYQGVNPTAIKPNYQEALGLLGLPGLLAGEGSGNRAAQIATEGWRILEMTGAQIAAITLDQEGALIFEQGREPYRTYAHPQPHTRAAGAGDTFASAFIASLAAGADSSAAAEVASAAASIVVNKEGTAICYADELKVFFSTEDKFVTDVFQLAGRMAAYRRENRRIVFTNGCFDILHRGHITYLNQAKAFGDVLIVGLNSDASVGRLKGPTRPINSLEDRAQVLSALSCVDHIVPFDGDTPHELIRVIQPDVFVKGGDYTRETLPEAELVERLGGEVKILSYLQDHSTTSIIERIRKAVDEESPRGQ